MSDASSGLGSVIVDGRLRQRYIEVKKAAGRRRLHRLVLVAVVGAVVLTVAGLGFSPAFDVDEIAVVGATHTDPAALAESTGVATGDALVLVDAGEVARRLESLPWVADATVHRAFPGTLEVSVVERSPVALIVDGDQGAVVDATGRVLEVGAAPAMAALLQRGEVAGTQPVFIEVPGSGDGPALAPGEDLPPAVAVAADVANRVATTPAGGPSGAVRTVIAGDDLALELRDGGRVVLGDSTDLDTKLESLRTMIARADLSCLRTLDLRVATRPVLTREDACS